ncbi:MAG: cytochrome c [Candidatus Obscuribacterales bacterium]|nr:cytochrome c [Candidatus Obscuribacterales bacterium]
MTLKTVPILKGEKMRLVPETNKTILAFMTVISLVTLSSCSITEEVKRIEEVEQAERRQQASMSSDLTGEQLFARSCNTCHPGGSEGMGPSLVSLSSKFPSDPALIAFIRKGKGLMPPQPETTINTKEMANLVAYLRALKID